MAHRRIAEPGRRSKDLYVSRAAFFTQLFFDKIGEPTMEYDTNQPLSTPAALIFPHAPADWDETEALKMAQAEGIDFQSDHRRVIQALQEYFFKHEKRTMNIRELHDALDEAFHLKGGMKYLYKLLPGGPVAQGCRFAGLPIPAGALDKSFGSVQ
jgi:TusE/DsrC/DsvC family sulfur relay protein